MTFDDLIFSTHPNHPGGTVARAFFPNGYGVSVIQSAYSYGGRHGLYELAVLKGTEDSYDLTYETPITNDVEGHLTPGNVTNLMQQVEALEQSQ